MSRKLNCKNLRGITICAILLFLFCFFSASTAQSENILDGKFLKAWIKGNGKQLSDNGKLKEAKLKKKDSEINVMIEVFDCDSDEGNGLTQSECDGYCYYIFSIDGDCDPDTEPIGELYTCGEDEKTGSAWIDTEWIDNDDGSYGFFAAFITKQLYTKDDNLKKLESKSGSGFGYMGDIRDMEDTVMPVFVLKNVLLKATEINCPR